MNQAWEELNRQNFEVSQINQGAKRIDSGSIPDYMAQLLVVDPIEQSIISIAPRHQPSNPGERQMSGTLEASNI